MQADSHVAGALSGRCPADAPDGGRLLTSAFLRVQAAALPDMLDSSKGCLSLVLSNSVAVSRKVLGLKCREIV